MNSKARPTTLCVYIKGDQMTKYKPQAKYDSNNTMRVYIKLNVNTDADIIEYLNASDNKQGLIKKLIRDEIERSKG